jgi:hypothetical protein
MNWADGIEDGGQCGYELWGLGWVRLVELVLCLGRVDVREWYGLWASIMSHGAFLVSWCVLGSEGAFLCFRNFGYYLGGVERTA